MLDGRILCETAPYTPAGLNTQKVPKKLMSEEIQDLNTEYV